MIIALCVPTVVTDEIKEWLATETAKLVERAGIDSYVAAPLVEATDRFFPDDWHRDDGGVVRLAKRVFDYAGLGDVAITADLGKDERAISATEVTAEKLHLIVDPDHLTDPLSAVAELVHLATYVFRLRKNLGDPDDARERELIELTAVYLGFGILITNAAYRYRAEGEIRGNTVYTRWSHDEQGSLPASVLAYALAMQLVARGADASELRAVKRQLETNQREAFDAACDELTHEHVMIALGLPDRSTWPAKREPPAKTKALVRKQPELPAATVKNRNFLGHNTGKPVLRRGESRVIELGFGALFLSMVPTIALAVSGFGGLAMLALVGITAAGFFGGSKIRRDVCGGRGCGVIRLPPDAERCPRCGGTIVGRMLPKENLLEAEERLQLTDGDEDIDVGEPSESVELPEARVRRGSARVDGSANTRIG